MACAAADARHSPITACASGWIGCSQATNDGDPLPRRASYLGLEAARDLLDPHGNKAKVHGPASGLAGSQAAQNTQGLMSGPNTRALPSAITACIP